jgi:peptidoglycan/xylan/chitin deacetylase (PgdA/CDA1 family)
VRSVAITIDDLPVVSTRSDLATWQGVTRDLLAAVVRNEAPATGFVIGSRLPAGDAAAAEGMALLRQWLDAGLDLGNHTYTHRSLHDIPLDEYEADVLRGDSVVRVLLAERGRTPGWFRHPYLHTGRDTATRAGFERFLSAHHYRVAPVTIDNSDWQFARAYDLARDSADDALVRRTADAYIAYMDTVFGFYEAKSRALLGREPPQVLLLHANRLNADTFHSLVAVLRRRGYAFVTLDEALRDPVYAHTDAYTGAGGITWLHRWALTEGRGGAFFAGEPEVPEFVVERTAGR